MLPGESDIRDERVFSRAAFRRFAPAEVEQQPLDGKGRHELCRFRREVALREDRLWNWQRGALIASERFRGQLRRICALHQPHRQRRLPRTLPCLSRLRIGTLREIDERRKIVLAVTLNDHFVLGDGRTPLRLIDVGRAARHRRRALSGIPRHSTSSAARTASQRACCITLRWNAPWRLRRCSAPA